jgi:DNA helicase-2/ATP-dependent DNA helicase PcrA
VEWGDGPMLVLAGPGSGKTAVLTLRIANLIQNSPEESFRILGLTFTVKAANEMESRIRELLGEHTKRVQLNTFHSFCAGLLRQHGSHLGLRPDFSVITDDKDRVAILKKLRDTGVLEIENPEDSLKKIDLMFTHGINAEELAGRCKEGQEEFCRRLQTIFEHYMDQLVKENQLDFGSMLHFTRQLLESMPRVARQVRTVFRYICVDEFQDTNLAQYKVLRLLAPDADANLFVVADDDQIIFQWNGADPKRLEELKSDYQPQVIQLPENFRCPSQVVEIANRLIAHNPGRMPNKQDGIAHKPNSDAVRLEEYKELDSEIAGLVAEIEKIPVNLRETCLVIARSNKLLVQIKQAMDRTGINAEIARKQQDFSSPLVQLLYYTLKLHNAPDSRSMLNKLCSTASLVNGISVSAEDVVARSEVGEVTMLQAFFSIAASSQQLAAFAEKGLEFINTSMSFTEFSEQALRIFDGLNACDHEDDVYPDYEDDKNNWQRISRQTFRTHGGSVSLHVFLQEMDLSPKSKSLTRDCVRLQTVHTAKGAEFDNVYVVGLAEDQFPTYFAIKNGDAAIQEERRNCFVAITRTSRKLYLSYAGSYFGWSKQPSRFLQEMGLIGE